MTPGSTPGLREPFWSRVREVWDVLAFTFDFDAFEQPLGSDAYATPAPWLPAFVVPGAEVSVIGRDGTGGVYVSCERGRERCCLHLDTQGNAVALGEDWPEALALLVALPYWPELLAQCPSGELAALRGLAQRLEREACEDFPDLPAAREELRAFLELPEVADPVLRLKQRAVDQAVPVTVWSPHGWRYGSPVRRGGHVLDAR
ncbi:MAG TPA: hypothetical protein VFS67_22950 [Polyangiaceae bacterium]|jgi:hypothetical protein|nr:hypothetical protein [Polyangiaceae bacterium]